LKKIKNIFTAEVLPESFLDVEVRQGPFIMLIMVSPESQKIIKSCADEFGVKTVWLFGSALQDEQHSRDYDLAVEGLSPENFFDFYGRLFFELPKPVDLVDLSQDPSIASIIREKGVVIYERRS